MGFSKCIGAIKAIKLIYCIGEGLWAPQTDLSLPLTDPPNNKKHKSNHFHVFSAAGLSDPRKKQKNRQVHWKDDSSRTLLYTAIRQTHHRIKGG